MALIAPNPSRARFSSRPETRPCHGNHRCSVASRTRADLCWPASVWNNPPPLLAAPPTSPAHTAAHHERKRRLQQPLRPAVLGVGVATSSCVARSESNAAHATPCALAHGRNVRRSVDSSQHKQFDDTASIAESVIAPLPEPRLPDLDLPQSELDLTMTFESILAVAAATEPEYVCFLVFCHCAFLSMTGCVSCTTPPTTPVLALASAHTLILTLLHHRTDKVSKRASNVLKLAQENEKLKEELRAMNARLEAAERKQQELRQREAAQHAGATKTAAS